MDNSKIIQYKSKNIVPSKESGKQDLGEKKEIIKPSVNTLRKTRGFPSITSIWSNSIYSFNKNYLKNIPAVDNIVNKIIKSFFTINALANNPEGKKSRLVQRRYKRLSLNKILVSKSEIKHSNDKVFITVYLFNKKKRSLLLKLKNLYNSLSLRKNFAISSARTLLSKKLKGGAVHTMKNKNQPIALPLHKVSSKSYKRLNINQKVSITKKSNIHFVLSKKSKKNQYVSWKKNLNQKIVNIAGLNQKNNTASNNKATVINYKLKNIVLNQKNLSTIVRNKIKKIKLLNSIFVNKYAYLGLASLDSVEKKNLKTSKKQGFLAKHSILREKRKYIISHLDQIVGIDSIDNKYYENYKGKKNINYGRGKNSIFAFKNRFIKNGVTASFKSKNQSSPFVKRHQGFASLENIFKNKILYYNKLNNLTRYNIREFMISIGFAHNSKAGYSFNGKAIGNNLKIFAKHFNKYKLYNSNITSKSFAEKGYGLSNMTINIKANKQSLANRKPNYSIYKLKSMYKLFALYNNINLVSAYKQNNKTSLPLASMEARSSKDFVIPSLYNITDMSSIYSKKILLNTYKLLRKSYIKFSLGFDTKTDDNLKNITIKAGQASSVSPSAKDKDLNAFNTVYMNRSNVGLDSTTLSNKPKNFTLKFKKPLTRKVSKNSKSYITLKKTMKSVILINKFNRIDRFFNKYKNILLTPNNISHIPIISPQIISSYKINFLNDLLEKELLYVYYLKLLSYNNAVFKNWFLYSLKNLISKIYNKKVIFNLINLKYIHLNSDILSQAVNIRLRNFKKNRVVKVLKKVIKLVPISKVNIYACDEHSAIYKYVHNYHNKFKSLKLDIFKELGLIDTNLHSKEKNLNFYDKNSKKSFSPCKIKRLNHIQASTINFIKYKSAFGVRFEAAGRLTKRSTASRSIFKFRYNGTLRNNPIINNSISSVIIKNNIASNLQFTKIASKTRNGSFGLKGWINNN